ncbi:MAG: hypothetical protein NW237_10595 [Cyanobacteriota bacterium]|nr:hypothetical protein [Cyanobacteriota bacterium]
MSGLLLVEQVQANPALLDPALSPDFSTNFQDSSLPEVLTVQSSGQRSNTEAWRRILATYRYDDSWYLTLGHELYETWGSDPTKVEILPIQLGRDFQLGVVSGTIGGGLDISSEQVTQFSWDTRFGIPLGSGLTPELLLNCQPYRGRATSLTNEIYACRGGFNLFRQWDPQWQSFLGYRYGHYSDDNTEHQVIGSATLLPANWQGFSLSANLFNWSYTRDQPTYFSPPDFLVLTAEVKLAADLTRDLECGLAVAFGQQRLKSQWSEVNTWQGRCQWQWSEGFSLQSNLGFSNVQNQVSSLDRYNNAEWGLTLRWLF